MLLTKTPYGYKSVKGEMYVNKNTAPIVKRIFDEYANGHGFTEIVGGFMEEDVPRPGKAKVWYPATIRAILTNKIYTGEYISGHTRQEMHHLHNMPEESWIRIKDHHEAIISEALFDAVQERLIPRDYVRRVDEPDSNGELVGIAYCGNCDEPLLNKDGKYYCRKCKAKIDEGVFHQSLISTAMSYRKTLPNPDKMN